MRIALGLAALACVFAVFFFVTRPTSILNRVNILVGTSPVSIWSWNKTDGSFTVILLPASVAADSSAYGRYTLEALWKLGFIDKKEGLVLSRSLTDILALPIPWFIGEGEQLAPTDEAHAYGRRMFSARGLIPMVLGKRPTNIPLGTWVSFSWALSRARSDAVHILDLVHQTPAAEETLPDETVRQFLDPERLDVVLKGRFEDERVREEAITVGVYNTTATPALGTYAARLLTQEGVLVVAVGNSESEIETCMVEGSQSVVESHTARVIAELFGCSNVVTQIQEQADLNVRLGTAFAQQFTSGD